MKILALQPTIICWAFSFDFSIFGPNPLLIDISLNLSILLNDDRLFHFHLQQLITTKKVPENNPKFNEDQKSLLYGISHPFKINWNRQTRNSFDFSDKLKIAIRKSSETKSNCHGMKTFRQIKLFQLFFSRNVEGIFERKFEGLKLWVMVQFWLFWIEEQWRENYENYFDWH